MTLPFALFALPAGIVADNVDRRRMMIVVQSLQLFVGTLLATWVVVDAIPPYLLLLLIFLLGTGTAISLIPFQSSVVELVPREQGPEDDYVLGGDLTLDPEPLVRDAIALELPFAPLCSPTCRGLCPRCGGDRNLGECSCTEAIDPRWAALERFRED